MKRLAVISECGKYRYSLHRVWDENLPNILFIMLNPSKADAELDDPTILRCIQIAKKNGFGSMSVGNVYAYRTTYPDELEEMSTEECLGPDNTSYLSRLLGKSDKVIVGWGNSGYGANQRMASLLKDNGIYPVCLKINKDGTPKHPLYCRVDSQLIPWSYNQDRIVNQEDAKRSHLQDRADREEIADFEDYQHMKSFGHPT